MSVVAGLVSGGKVWMASDSLISEGKDIFETRLSPKTFAWDGFVFGVVGDARAVDLIYAVFEPPEPTLADDYVYMVDQFVEELRKMLEKRDERKIDFTMLVGHNGVIYIVDTDYSVCVPTSPYFAIGGGSSFALASLAATSAVGKIKDPAKRVEKAVAIACKRRADCGGRIIVTSN